MRGLELARAYYETFGGEMLRTQFPSVLPHVAVGLFGSGSECFGYDDEVSRDHDFEPGFMILLPGEDVVDRRTELLLERAYARLPESFQGFSRSLMPPAGGRRHGVIRLAEFLSEKTGTPDGRLTRDQWMKVPEYALAEVVNGAVFYDGPGEVTAIRRSLSVLPRDVRRKKLAGHLMMMAQSGGYNYSRCLRHGETGAAQLAVGHFVHHAMAVIFLLNDVYQPYYKWAFRALRDLPRLSLEAEVLQYLICTDNDGDLPRAKQDVIDGVNRDVIDEMKRQKLSMADCDDPEKHAWSVNDAIADPGLRNAHILAGV